MESRLTRLKDMLNKMKILLPCVLMMAGAGLMQASIVETISFNLSALHAGSTLSGTFTLSDAPAIGDTAPAVLAFSDPADYSPISLTTTITITNGTPSGFAVLFSGLSFTNLSGTTTPIDRKDVILSGFGFAKCASFPCTASGNFQDRSPAVFSSTYTISPVAVPEPRFTAVVAILLTGMFFARRLVSPV
jgi:hypothetical protein